VEHVAHIGKGDIYMHTELENLKERENIEDADERLIQSDQKVSVQLKNTQKYFK
jgi:hypothetical protein